MRILFNALQGANRSGTGRYITELGRALLGSTPELRMEFLCSDGRIRSGEEAFSSQTEGALPPLQRLVQEQIMLPRCVQKGRCDLLHFPAGTGLFFSSAAHVLTIHDLCYLKHPEWFPASRVRYYKALMGKNARNAARIFADSQATAQDVEEFLAIPGDRIDVIPLGIDPGFAPASAETRATLRRRIPLPEHFFLFVGTLEPRKNIPTLIRAWSKLAADLPDLVLAGRTGWKVSKEDLQQLAGKESHRLHFLDHVPGSLLPALYSEAQVFVYPSFMEGFGLPPLEAMACGTPVITSKCSSLPEVTGDAALLVSPEDEEALFGALECLAGNKALRLQMSGQGLHQAARFSWKQTAAMTVEGYRKALEKN